MLAQIIAEDVQVPEMAQTVRESLLVPVEPTGSPQLLRRMIHTHNIRFRILRS
jgi:hypothetical protein